VKIRQHSIRYLQTENAPAVVADRKHWSATRTWVAADLEVVALK
jgi:hypothetical protein